MRKRTRARDAQGTAALARSCGSSKLAKALAAALRRRDGREGDRINSLQARRRQRGSGKCRGRGRTTSVAEEAELADVGARVEVDQVEERVEGLIVEGAVAA